MLRQALIISVGVTLLAVLAACTGQPLAVTVVETVEVQTGVEKDSGRHGHTGAG